MKRLLCAVALLWFAGPLLANEANEKLMAMSEKDRHALLTEYVKTNQRDCDAVDRSMLLSNDASKAALWSVSCRNGASYVVTISADAQMHPFAMNCDDVKDYGKLLNMMERRIGQPQTTVAECWKKF